MKKIIVLLSYVLMIFINFLAGIGKINHISTGQISDAYPNLFTPIGFTFSIWALIYILLGLFAFYGFDNISSNHKTILSKTQNIFIITSLLNISWIFAWHYQQIIISFFIIFSIWILLAWINLNFPDYDANKKANQFMYFPFRIYYGWISIATIANFNVLLVFFKFSITPNSQIITTIILLLFGLLMGILNMVRIKSLSYGLVFLWAYVGITLKHILVFEQNYMKILMICYLCIILILLSLTSVFRIKKNKFS